MRVVPMTRNNLAMRSNNGFLWWCWWWQTGLALFAGLNLALFAGLNVHNIHPLSSSRRVLIDRKRQAISLVTGHYRHDNFWRGRRRRLFRSCSNST
jgi:hypothetical protein